jgi:hypothetical protein
MALITLSGKPTAKALRRNTARLSTLEAITCRVEQQIQSTKQNHTKETKRERHAEWEQAQGMSVQIHKFKAEVGTPT